MKISIPFIILLLVGNNLFANDLIPLNQYLWEIKDTTKYKAFYYEKTEKLDDRVLTTIYDTLQQVYSQSTMWIKEKKKRQIPLKRITVFFLPPLIR